MLNHHQVVRLLAFCAAYDQRTVGEFDIQAWQMASGPGRWSYAAVQRVVVEHYSAGADRPRLTPAMVTDRLRAVRGRAAESFELPRLPDELADADYPEWLRQQLSEHCDALLERWATSGEEPPRAIQPAPAAVGSLDELVTRAPIQHRKAISAGARTIRERRVRLDPEQREKARAELDAARSEDAS